MVQSYLRRSANHINGTRPGQLRPQTTAAQLSSNIKHQPPVDRGIHFVNIRNLKVANSSCLEMKIATPFFSMSQKPLTQCPSIAETVSILPYRLSPLLQCFKSIAISWPLIISLLCRAFLVTLHEDLRSFWSPHRLPCSF